MRLRRLETHGIGSPFRHTTVAVDFDQLGPGVVAIIGGNGQGKSHVIELSGPGTLYRELPSYRDPKGKKGEALIDHVHPDTRDAYTDLTLTIGSEPHRVRVNLDGKRRKTEAFLYRGASEAPVAGPLTSAVDEAIERVLPSRSLLLAGAFACQGGFDGFFRLGPTERKSLFNEMLGNGHLEAMASAAGDQEKAATEAVEITRRELATCADAAARFETLTAAHERHVQEIAERQAALEAAESARADAIVALDLLRADLTRAEASLDGIRRERERIESERTRAAGRVAELTQRLAQLDAATADVAAIERAGAELVALDAEIDTRRTERTRVADALAATTAEVATLDGQVATLRADHARLVGEHRAAQAALPLVAAAEEAADLLPDAQAALDRFLGDEQQALAAMPGLKAAAETEAQAEVQRASLEARAKALAPQADLAGRIPGAPECATCPFPAAARDAAVAVEAVRDQLAALPLPTRAAREALQAATQQLTTLASDFAAHRQRVADLTRAAAITDEQRQLAAREDDLAAQVSQVVSRGMAAKGAADGKRAEIETLRRTVAEHDGHLATANTRRAALTALDARRQAAQDAIVERAGVRAALDEATAAHGAALLTPLPELPSIDAAQVAVADGEQRVRDAEFDVSGTRQLHQAASEAAARTSAGLDALREAMTRAEALRAQEATQITEAADWAVLKKALGARGIQALLIDAAGPEVSADANELLAECYTSRFQIAMTTTQPTADGKGVREVFEPRLLDAETGRDGTRGSGGETALYDLALRLAIGLYHSRRSGVPIETLWLDEATAALSADNAPRYLDMVRYAMRKGGWHQALMVTHDPHLWESADARLIVEDGTVRTWAPETPRADRQEAA